VKATVYIHANPDRPRGFFHIDAPDIGLSSQLEELPPENPLVVAILSVAEQFNIRQFPALTLRIKSSIPIASGLGSGAAVSVAIIRALSSFFGKDLLNEQVSELAYRVERIHHGNPSGIDNTVVTYEQPIYFIRGQPFQILKVHTPDTEKAIEGKNRLPSFSLVIADTGIASPTKQTVADVQRRWQEDPSRYNSLFDAIAEITENARRIIEQGPIERLGLLMNENHHLLQEMGVSCDKLDKLVNAALDAGAVGAKLSGAGRGGNIIAITASDNTLGLASALDRAGAVNTIITHIYPNIDPVL